ncbi:MAG: hypothetical protein ACI4BA_06570 [Prevotella sp.]
MNGKDNKLLSVLESFSGVTEFTDGKKKLDELESKFEAIAKEVILGGCFEINGVRRIYPLEIEFYYHEEGENGLKDPVMYHTDNHENKKLEYYPLGSLNCHVSGIDVTFENVEKQYRASFLIRKYKVCEYKNEKWEVVEDKECEKRSTYIYEDMFMNIPLFDGINIKWVSGETVNPTKEIVRKQRINVAEYKRDSDGKFTKVEITKDEYDKLSDVEQQKYFSYSGKKLKKCKREWNYSVVNR